MLGKGNGPHLNLQPGEGVEDWGLGGGGNSNRRSYLSSQVSFRASRYPLAIGTYPLTCWRAGS